MRCGFVRDQVFSVKFSGVFAGQGALTVNYIARHSVCHCHIQHCGVPTQG
jgi:hypothetical protein